MDDDLGLDVAHDEGHDARERALRVAVGPGRLGVHVEGVGSPGPARGATTRSEPTIAAPAERWPRS